MAATLYGAPEAEKTELVPRMTVLQGCASGQPHDTGAPRCDPECSSAAYAWDCHFCRCQHCTFCAARGAPAGRDWRVLEAEVKGTRIDVSQLWCPGGCEFKVHAPC